MRLRVEKFRSFLCSDFFSFFFFFDRAISREKKEMSEGDRDKSIIERNHREYEKISLRFPDLEERKKFLFQRVASLGNLDARQFRVSFTVN